MRASDTVCYEQIIDIFNNAVFIDIKSLLIYLFDIF